MVGSPTGWSRIVKQFVRASSGRVELDPRLARLPVIRAEAPPVLLEEVGASSAPRRRPGDDAGAQCPDAGERRAPQVLPAVAARAGAGGRGR